MEKKAPILYPRSSFFWRNFPFSIHRCTHLSDRFLPGLYHVREFYKIVYFFQGEGEYIADGRHYPVQGGTAILVHPRFETTYRIFSDSLDICNILFLPDFIRHNLDRLKDSISFFSIFEEGAPAASGIYVFPGMQKLEKLIARMQEEYRTCEENYRIVLELLLTDLLVQLCRNAQKGMAKFKPEDSFSNLKLLLEEHCTDSFSLQEIAEKLGLSRSSLCQLYHSRTGSTIMADLTRRRLELARQMLLDSDLPIAGICYRCGFHDLSCFYRNFRRAFGMTPRTCRKIGRG